MSDLVYRLYQWLWLGLDYIYPPCCGGCERPGWRWCPSCQDNVRLIEPPVCSRCGQPLQSDKTANDLVVCVDCQENPPSYQMLRSWAAFEGPLRNALHRLKYRRDISLGEALSRPMIELFKRLAWPVEVIIPVPLSVARLAQRGYNQAALLARPLALGLNLEFCPKALLRIRDTASQVGLSPSQRHQNVHHAFQAKKLYVYEKTVLLVDDVATTGATLAACAEALLAAEAKAVYCLTLARSVVSKSL